MLTRFQAGEEEVVLKLLEAKADINFKNSAGLSALECNVSIRSSCVYRWVGCTSKLYSHHSCRVRSLPLPMLHRAACARSCRWCELLVLSWL